MLLLLTSSGDATADLLAGRFEKPFFRFNLDSFEEYAFRFGLEDWEIANPSGLRISSKTATRCAWWKVFLSLKDEDQYIRSEIRYAANELYSWFRCRGLVIGNPPSTDELLGKVRQSSIARNYFKVPAQHIVWGDQLAKECGSSSNWVVKSLSSQLVSPGYALFTSEVVPSDLDPRYPWYLQERIDSKRDVTVLVVGDKHFSFWRDRSSLKSLDWREEVFSNPLRWNRFELASDQENALTAMLNEMNIYWGRLDFLETERGLVFLELNPNGQWGFLDPEDEHGIISCVAQYFEQGASHD